MELWGRVVWYTGLMPISTYDTSDKCFDKYKVPEHLRGGIRRYLEERIQPGQCLQAVLENDLREAVSRADDETYPALKFVVEYLYNEAPSEAYGSKGCVSKWLQGRGRNLDA